MSKSVGLFSRNFLKLWLIKLHKAVATLGSSFWFVPSTMIIAAIIAAQYVFPLIQQVYPNARVPFLPELDSAQTAMQIVQLAATSLITVTSIAFSMTLVALVMASNSFGPRLIRSFMQSKKTQCVLGFFTAGFVYCICIIRQINLESGVTSHPNLAVSIAMLLAILGVFVLIFFIHHVAVSIRADSVVDNIAEDLLRDMQRLQCQTQHRTASANALNTIEDYPHTMLIKTRCMGYVQALEYSKIAEIASTHDALVNMHIRAGDYVYPGTEMALLYSHKSIPSTLSFDDAVVTGTQRTPLQDPAFAINQLVEMALRALSPSLDDPFTAMTCIDKLAAALATFSASNLPKTLVLDEQHNARVLSNEEGFTELFEIAFSQIRQASVHQLSVMKHLLASFDKLLKAGYRAEHLKVAIKPQLDALQDTINKQLGHACSFDKEALLKQCKILEKSLL